MKNKNIIFISTIVLFITFGFAGDRTGTKVELPFYVYTESGSLKNHFIPSGFMGDWDDIKLNPAWQKSPASGKTCTRVEYHPKGLKGWAGVVWQYPENNWGMDKGKQGGYDLSDASEVIFMARGEHGDERVEFKCGGIMNPYGDTDGATIGEIGLNVEWSEYSIDVSNKDMSYIISGFMFVANKNSNPDGAVFYIDEIVYSAEQDTSKIRE